MASRPALALVQPTRRIITIPSRRTLAIGASLVGLLALAYLAARQTPLFAVHELEIEGAPPRVTRAVRSAADQLLGTSLVALDGDELLARIEALPIVRSARYDRAFPHTLRIVVEPERPVAVVEYGRAGAWVVSERGRIIRRASLRALARFPRVSLPPGSPLAPGAAVESEPALIALRALGLLPRPFPMRVREARVQAGRIMLVLAGDAELRLGEPAELALKLAVAERVLRSLTSAEREELAYVDLGLPERPVAGSKTQLEG